MSTLKIEAIDKKAGPGTWSIPIMIGGGILAVVLALFGIMTLVAYFSHGIQTEYYSDGKLKSEIDFYSPNTPYYSNKRYFTRDGWEKTYYHNGQLQEFSHYDSGERTGSDIQYYDDGSVFKKTNYENGQPDGRDEEYFPNGQLKRVTIWKNGQILAQKDWHGPEIGWLGDNI